MTTYEDPFDDLLKIMQTNLDELLEHQQQKYVPPSGTAGTGEQRDNEPVSPVLNNEIEAKERKYEQELNLTKIIEEV